MGSVFAPFPGYSPRAVGYSFQLTQEVSVPVDFNKLRAKKQKQAIVEPVEIFRRLPKAPGINDLYTSQAQVLQSWFDHRNQRDVVVKLHTGGGKTLVGLLMGQSTLNERREPVLYLVPTVQLVNQVLEQAKTYGISAVAYKPGEPLNDTFVNANAIMVGTYKALFNGRSKFGIRGGGSPQPTGAVILDDAHVAFSVVRDSFTLEVQASEERERYQSLSGLFRKAFRDTDRLGTFDDTVRGAEYGVLEVPYWSWNQQLDAVREQLKTDSEKYELVWPLLRDNLHLCHALISRTAFTITPVLPLVDMFPAFSEAPRRIYMSATIADDSEIIRTFDADGDAVEKSLSSRSLAGISERMILSPDLMPFKFDVRDAIEKLLEWVERMNLGSVVLTPSKKAAEQWSGIGEIAEGPAAVQKLVSALRSGASRGPVVLANRYDGIDLPGDACRLLVMYGLPKGTSDYEVFRASALYGGATITRMLAQRIEQGIGRGARGAGDHCVIILAGADLAGWITKDKNFRFLTSATRAQLEMGIEISKEVSGVKDLGLAIKKCLDRDQAWTEYHAETLAELVDEENLDATRLKRAEGERKAFDLWKDGYHEKAISRLERILDPLQREDPQACGWFQQLAARIADHWGNTDRAEDLQRQAFANNRNLFRPKVRPPYRPLPLPGPQERAIVQQIGGYRLRRGFLQSFEEAVAYLNQDASAGQFEQALVDLATMIGLVAERFDVQGEGPDVLWLLPGRIGIVIEAKSRKKGRNALTKEEHGQLLVAGEWFTRKYLGYECIRASVYPTSRAIKAAEAKTSYALTYEKLNALVSDARVLLTALCDSQLSLNELEAECSRLLRGSSLRAERLVGHYLEPFADEP